ncbi:beta strand repeat-containing protein [Vreelandella indica]|uniref:beta strand repeat-containing protein n=1 Tax=Vreelandella indica TaxID=3126500 RepID=UPI00300E50AB
MAIPGFNKEFYLNAKLAQLQNNSETAADWAGKDAAFLEARFSAVGLTAQEHYEQYGYQEDLAPNAFFDPAEYIRAKATAMFNDSASSYLTIDAAAEDFVNLWGGNVYNHYLQYGEEEDINPSNDFDVSSYLEAKLAKLQSEEATAAEWAGKGVADVAAEFEAAGITALEHFTMYGDVEGLSATAVPAEEQVEVDTSVPGQVFSLTTGVDSETGTDNDDTFNATGATLTALDSVDGGRGTDTLVVKDADAVMGTAQPAGMNIAVEKIDINTAGALGNVASAGQAAQKEIDKLTFTVNDGTSTSTLDVTYGGVTATTAALDGSATQAEVNTLVADAINAIAGSTVATIVGADVIVTAPQAGTALPAINVAASTPTDISLAKADLQANQDAVEATNTAVYDLSGVTGLTDVTAKAAGNVNVKLADTTDASVTTTTGSVTVAGGKSVTTSGATGAVSVTGAAGLTDVSVTGATSVNIADNGTEADTLATVSISGATGTSTIGSDALTSLSVANSNQNVTVNAAAGTRSLDLAVDKLTGGTIADAEATTVNVTASGTKSSGTSLNFAKATSLSLAGDVAVSTALTAQAAELAITSTNSAGTTITTQLDNDVTFTGGAGADSVSLGATTKAIAMGAGDDSVTVGAALGTGGTVAGGDGEDTLKVANGTYLLADDFTGFEVLDVTGGQGTYDLSLQAGFTSVKLTGDAANNIVIDKAAAGTTIDVVAGKNSNDVYDDELDVALADASGTSDVLTVNATFDDSNNSTDSFDISVLDVNADANGEAIETVRFVANASTSATSQTTIDAFDATDHDLTIASLDLSGETSTVEIAGNAEVEISDIINAASLTKIDASASTGKLTINLDDSADDNTLAVLGSSGNDAVVMTGNAAENNIIVGNGGADSITLAAAGTKETVRLASDTDSVLSLSDADDNGTADAAAGYDVITNFTTGEDKLELSSALGLGAGDARTAITGKGTATDGDNFTNEEIAVALENVIGDGVGFFNDGAADRAVATYAFDDTAGNETDALAVFIDSNADGSFTAGDDQMVMLNGVTSIAVSDIVFG